MLESILSLQIGGFYGGSIGNLLTSWEQAGVFSYVLPFLLIFAVVFGILMKSNIFGQNSRGLNAVVALVIGLLALQFDLVPLFFSEIFPRLGVGLSVLLIALILIGLSGNEGAQNYVIIGLGAIIFLIVLFKTTGTLGWASGYWWSNYWPGVLGVIAFVIVVGLVIRGVGGAARP